MTAFSTSQNLVSSSTSIFDDSENLSLKTSCGTDLMHIDNNDNVAVTDSSEAATVKAVIWKVINKFKFLCQFYNQMQIIYKVFNSLSVYVTYALFINMNILLNNYVAKKLLPKLQNIQ